MSFAKMVGVDLLCGSVAGAISALTSHPVDTIKVRVQLSNPKISMAECIRKILKHEGPSGFYKGVLSPMIGLAPVNAFGFAGNEIGKRALKPYNMNENSRLILSGFFAGWMSLFAYVPLEMCKVTAQKNNMEHVKYR